MSQKAFLIIKNKHQKLILSLLFKFNFQKIIYIFDNKPYKFCAVMQFSFGIHLLMALTYFMLKNRTKICSIERKHENMGHDLINVLVKAPIYSTIIEYCGFYCFYVYSIIFELFILFVVVKYQIK